MSCGFDAVRGDFLGGLDVTPQCFGLLCHKLCALASGRVVLVLEGGYSLRGLSDSAAACVASLLGYPPQRLEYDKEKCRQPNAKAVQTLIAVRNQLKSYWKALQVDGSCSVCHSKR